MHRYLLLLCLFTAFSTHASGAVNQRLQRIPLDSGWTVRQLPGDGMAESRASSPPAPSAGWFQATVPGDVHLDLLMAGKIPDPFYRDNESKLQWIEQAGWEYRETVHVDPSVLAREHVELVFDGLDTVCTVFLNGQRLGAPDNMFRQWRFDVKRQLHEGANELRIVFPAPMEAAKAVQLADPWYGRVRTETKGYVRKAVYEFGWDWGPRFATSGVWKPAYLEVWDNARLQDVFVEQPDVRAASAHIDLHADVLASDVTMARVSIAYGLNGTPHQVERSVTLSPGMNRITFPIEIDHPHRWFPSGYGEQPLYTFHIAMRVGAREIDSKQVKTGLRSVELRRDLDQWGRSFEFIINGIPIYAKGADIIPFDSFPNRVTDANYRHILQSAKDANMNMVRLWGGGYYENEQFYELCDQLGLMVFHDMMFGNNWQPGFYAFKQNIGKEAEYQMTRLRNHPSIVLWDGNNETEDLREWGGNDKLPPKTHERIWEDYLTEFSGIIPTVEARVDPEIPYWPSTPSADYEELSDAYQSGDNHDWSVWHGGVDFSEYEKHHWRFTSEFGFQSFPEMRTIKSFTTPEDRASIFTPVMRAHQKNGDGNKLIQTYMSRYYGEPKDFAHFLYASQVLQAEAVRTGVEFWRRERPRSMGTLYWQLNDCWPVASWASIDYYGRWKALQYYARRFYAPLLVTQHLNGDTLETYVVSDKTTPQAAQLTVRVMRFDGSIVKQTSQNLSLPPLSSGIQAKLPLAELGDIDRAKVFASVELKVNGQLASSKLTYLVPTKQVQLPTPDMHTAFTKRGDGYDVEITSPVLEKSVFISLGDLDAETSENYFDILPHASVQVHIRTKSSEAELRGSMQLFSLGDAFTRDVERMESVKR